MGLARHSRGLYHRIDEVLGVSGSWRCLRGCWFWRLDDRLFLDLLSRLAL